MGTEEIETDVFVLGGGPGGSTISTFLRKRGYSVAIVEKDKHPRFHIGESLLPMNMPILERLGVLDLVKEIGVPKYGADFSFKDDAAYQLYDFANAMKDSPPNAYEVTRSEYDELLFRHAERSGAQSFEEVRIERVAWDDEKRVVAHGTKSDGTKYVFRARYMVDASGRDTFLSKKLGLKKKNVKHGSAAIFSHFKGVERRGGREEGNISIYWFDHGWMWMIPLRNDVMSVGFVCHPEYLKARKGTNEEFLMETLRSVPKAHERFAKAERIAEVRATGNYSYTSDRMSGPGFLMVGDAFAFIDPVFSSGVYLAMNSAEKAAAVVDQILRDPSRELELQQEYDRVIRTGIRNFSWFIYRFTTPGLRWIFKNPRNIYRMQEAVTSMLAGDVFGDADIMKRFRALRLVYAVRTVAELPAYVRNWVQRRRNGRDAFTDGTLSVDRESESAQL